MKFANPLPPVIMKNHATFLAYLILVTLIGYTATQMVTGHADADVLCGWLLIRNIEHLISVKCNFLRADFLSASPPSSPTPVRRHRVPQCVT